MSIDEDWRAPGAPAVPSPILTSVLARLETAYDDVGSIPVTTLTDEDLTRLVDAATRLVDRSTGVVMAAVGEADHRRLGDGWGTVLVPGTRGSGGRSARC
ncbi:hypothetical protein [Nocardioides sp. B-3]|uniref:hypothetical protein n=1 Tax=Nocardioides sp. B-3 TaxID=2895565 RepID=UPI0021536B14|nr:hypothetical protein [Nocardioides sp. B-3]UUZ58399.1 hypothetical protein LP418_19695 [Nocardioides sp. B-3]